MNEDNSKQIIFLELSERFVAEELKRDFISGGISSDNIKIKKTRGENLYTLSIDDFENNIIKVIKVLNSPEYGLEYHQIEEMFNITISI